VRAMIEKLTKCNETHLSSHMQAVPSGQPKVTQFMHLSTLSPTTPPPPPASPAYMIDGRISSYLSLKI